MKQYLLSSVLALLLLAGCGAVPQSIPEGLDWRAQSLQSGENGEILAAYDQQDVPPLDVTAQVEDNVVTLTDHAAGETYTGTLYPAEDAAPNSQVYTLAFPDQPEGYGVYGVTEYADGNRDATLYLTMEGRTLCLTAPLNVGT